MRPTALVATLLAVLTVPVAVSAKAATHHAKSASRHAKRAALRQKLSSLSHHLRSTRSALKAAKRAEADIQADLTDVRQRLRNTRTRLAAAKEHLERTREQQVKVQAALVESQQHLKARELTFARRMAANYRQGPVRYASVLLASRSMGDLITRGRFVRSIMEYDAHLIAQIKQDRLAVMEWKRQVDAKAVEVEAVKADLAERQADEAQEMENQRALLTEARARRASLEDELQTLESDSEEIAAKIRTLQDTPVGRARRMVAFTGRFIHPVNGPITSGFGMRFHPILHYSRLHAGVDFGVGYGTPIGAAASGVVVFSGVMRGYGNVIVIDHGGGLSTLYAHCSALLVGEGTSVSQGQIVARVGASGLATGPHLHFEIRKNGTPVDPMGSL